MTLTVAGVTRDEAFSGALSALVDAGFASALFARDAGLWGEAAAVEAAIRLGWTDFEDNAERVLGEAERLSAGFRATGVDRFVLCGMGGSSLAPLVIAPGLGVLDSTHPAAVREALEGDLARTAVIVSSKSGGTVETLSHLAAFEAAFAGAGINPSGRIVVVTDPGSKLEDAARASGQRVFLADPTVGGRFSALTAFGIVPSVLAGADMRSVVRDAAAVRGLIASDTPENPALVLAAAIAAGLPERFLLELVSDGSLPAELGLWIEQLVGESTGKDGRGVLPIALPAGATASAGALGAAAGSAEGAAKSSGTTALALTFSLDTTAASGLSVAGPLGSQLLLWQVVTAALGFLIGVDPFNQPDVEAAKAATRESLGAPGRAAAEELSPAAVRARLDAAAPVDGYVAIQAYVDPNDAELAADLEELRRELCAELGTPVAVGYGPRYLHSTGQFHKGGPNRAAFLQLIGLAERDVAIPGGEQSFGELIAAQAHGDASVLRERGREVITVETADPTEFVRALLGRG